MAYAPFQMQPYPFRTPSKEQVISERLCRIRNGPGLHDIPPDAHRPSTPEPANPPPTTSRKPHPLCKSITTATTKVTHCLSSACHATASALKSTKLFRPLFPSDPLSDPDSDAARFLHAHWAKQPPVPPPQPRNSSSYNPLARQPSQFHVIAARRPFLNDTSGKPIWELEAQAQAEAEAAVREFEEWKNRGRGWGRGEGGDQKKRKEGKGKEKGKGEGKGEGEGEEKGKEKEKEKKEKKEKEKGKGKFKDKYERVWWLM